MGRLRLNAKASSNQHRAISIEEELETYIGELDLSRGRRGRDILEITLWLSTSEKCEGTSMAKDLNVPDIQPAVVGRWQTRPESRMSLRRSGYFDNIPVAINK